MADNFRTMNAEGTRAITAQFHRVLHGGKIEPGDTSNVFNALHGH